MPQKSGLSAKLYVFPSFLKDFVDVHRDIPALIESLVHRRISRAFEEKLMLAVTAVNGCQYCAWFHSRSALHAGVQQTEIKLLLSRQLNQKIEDKELVALNFAIHYAEKDKKPDSELLNNLLEVYGKTIADDILLRLRLIYFGNLCGSTYKAFLSRLKGKKQTNSFWLTELIIFIILSPILGPLALMMKKAN